MARKMSGSTPSRIYGENSDLILSVMTLRNASIADRIDAAVAAGVEGIGWRFEDFTTEQYSGGLSEQDIIQRLDTAQIKAIEVEFFRDWIEYESNSAYREDERQLLELAGRLKARHINVAIFEPLPQETIVSTLRSLCDRARRYNLLVQLEFMVYTPPVDSLSNAWEIVRAVDRPNIGLLIDIWQWARAAETIESLDMIPAEHITSIQLSDTLATPLPDVIQESRHFRCIPGTGSLGLAQLLSAFEEKGITAPLSIEVMSDELDAMPTMQAAQIVADGTRSTLQGIAQ